MDERIRIGGIEIRFLEDGASTGGGLDLFEMVLEPRARMPVPHHHERWDETVVGLEGLTTWLVGGRDVALAPGQSLHIPRGVVHGFRNDGTVPARSLSILTPGVLGAAYFREMAALAAGGAPDPARLRDTMLRHGLVPSP